MMNRKKRDTDYAYAVARVRANELTLLTEADIDQLIDADSYESAMQMLSEHGWGDLDGVSDYPEYLEAHAAETWNLLEELLDDVHVLDVLLVQNDMQNVKAALKNLIVRGDTAGLYNHSTVYDTESVINAVAEKRFGDLPAFMQQPVTDAYNVLTSNANGQLSDAIIDKATLEEILKLGRESGSRMLESIAEMKVATADMKIALRSAKTGKSADFMDHSLAECSSLSVQSLKEAAMNGEEGVLNYLADTAYSEGAEKYKENSSAFEKWADDQITECVDVAKYTSFGIEPLVAYYIASTAEVNSVRIILSAKKNNQPKEVMRERVRKLYV